MAKIVVIQGHSDPSGNHFCHALAEAYIAGPKLTGHQVEHVDTAQLLWCFHEEERHARER